MQEKKATVANKFLENYIKHIMIKLKQFFDGFNLNKIFTLLKTNNSKRYVVLM